MPTEQRPLKVFLCHASGDKPKVRELYRYLRKRGIQPWLDVENLIPGQNWELEIPKAIQLSDAIIICLTNKSIDKEGYVQREIRFALDKALEIPEGRIFLIPVRLEECDLPYSLKKYQWVNLYEEGGYSKLVKALKERALQLENSTTELLKISETNPKQFPDVNDKVGETVKDDNPPRSTSITTSDKSKSSIHKLLDVRYFSVFIALIVLLFGNNFYEQITGKSIFAGSTPPTATRTATQRPTPTHVPTKSPPPSATATITRTPTLTLTPEPGYILVDKDEVFSLSPSVQALGELANEKYTSAERNKINQKLTFTINATPDVPMFWRWYWCAANEQILAQNLEEIDVIFEADGRLIPPEQLASVKYSYKNQDGDTWWCFTYSTVLKDWKPGKYRFIQTMVIKSTIHDGKDMFSAGNKVYDYTVTISP
jgi:hypothetical protein